MKQIGAVVLVWLLALGMIGCQVASAPTDVTDEALPAVTTEATQPAATRFVSTSRYQPTLPTEAPKPTQATEETGATQPTEVEGDASSYTPAPTEAPASTEAPPPAATEPPATEPPVTEAPATEAPAVSLDYSTAASYDGCRIELTKNEYRILLALMESKGKVVSREKLMERLWESDSFVDENTLTVNVNRLRKKLDAAGLANCKCQ